MSIKRNLYFKFWGYKKILLFNISGLIDFLFLEKSITLK